MPTDQSAAPNGSAATAAHSATIAATEDTLVVGGTGPAPRSAVLEGPRAQTTARITGGGKTWRARFPLASARWGDAVLPLPSGAYAIRIEKPDGDAVATTDLEFDPVLLPTVRVSLQGGVLTVGAPLDPAYDSSQGQDALERRYVARSAPLENAVFFESFYGRNASCNPLAIDREIARVAPDVIRYWSVVDLSVAVPEGAIAVVEGSPAWWRARGAARLLVVNDWLRRRYSRQRGQHVLQTWHGTPLKRLALHRPGFDPRRMAASIKESLRWDALLAQNPYAARILRRAYGFVRGSLWVDGYPRNDILATGDGGRTRRTLGIGEDERVVLYAPTWRDDRDQMVDFVDPEALAEAVGAVVLVRGHSRTLQAGTDLRGPRVIDVTAFPDVSRLLLVADQLVTDYSSVMFDFTVTGKPVFFLVPDIEHYRGELRGFYFDLAERAPGPLVRTHAELVDALQDESVSERYAGRYDMWRRVFNARDDGRAAERVVARLFDQGWIDR